MSIIIQNYKKKKKRRLFVKLYLMMLSLVFVSILLFSAVGILQINNFAKTIMNLAGEQEEVINDTLTKSMEKDAEKSFLNYVSLAAESTNYEFRQSRRDIELVAGEVKRILMNPENYTPVKIESPRKENEGEFTLQLVHSENISDDEAEKSGRESRIGNLEGLIKNILMKSNSTRACIISLMDGTSIICDTTPSTKISKDGNILYYDGSVRPWYAGAVISKGTYISFLNEGYYYDESMNVMIGVPVYIDGELAAVCGTMVNSNRFKKVFEETSVNDDTSAFIINTTGDVVFSGRKYGELSSDAVGEKSIFRGFNLELIELTERALNGKKGFERITLNDESTYIAYAPIKAVGWTEFIVISEEDLCKNIHELTGKTNKISKQYFEETLSNARHITLIFLTLTIALFLLATVSSNYLSKSMVSPILKLKEAAQNFINGTKNNSDLAPKYFGSLNISTGDEIEDLWLTMEDMEINTAVKIRKIRKFTEERTKLHAELSIASAIQANVLPKKFPAFPERDEFDIYATMTPAKEVGGDFYDFFLVDDDHLAMVMADVSDKGVPAAMFMMNSRTMIKDAVLSGKYQSPGEVLSYVNDRLIEGNSENMFVTVWLGILTISTGKMISANAGHEYPVVYREGRHFEFEKDIHGLMLGVYEGLTYKDFEWNFKHGDMFFIYTDGVPEATRADEEMFGNDRMLSSLNNAKDMNELKGILDSVKVDVDSFIGAAEQFDDLTM
nr:SpoIIE family protein phosphatase [Lachnospiraceae bacterium]